jgi:hypothetical protein
VDTVSTTASTVVMPAAAAASASGLIPSRARPFFLGGRTWIGFEIDLYYEQNDPASVKASLDVLATAPCAARIYVGSTATGNFEIGFSITLIASGSIISTPR